MDNSIVPRLDAPIVLVHGLFGFARFQVAGFTVADYFPAIADCMRAAGNRVLTPTLGMTAGIAERAAQLKDFLVRESPGQPVHILAHSMGGLDARYMISRLDMADAVLSLTTLGTPHAGSPVADGAVSKALERLIRPVLDFLDVPTQAFYDLTTASCRKFNEEVPDAPKVHYYSVAGKLDDIVRNPEWLPTYLFVFSREGPNDGVVSVASAKFGEWQDIWEGDHLSLINWFHPFGKNRTIFRDPVPRYGALLRKISGKG